MTPDAAAPDATGADAATPDDVRAARGAAVSGATVNGAAVNGAIVNGAIVNGAAVNGATVNGAAVNGATVNVATVPHRSPFRYAGGKTWFVPRLRAWLAAARPRLLVEPFAGGAICGLTAAAEGLVERVVLVECDDDVAAVWQAVFGGDAEALAARVEAFSMSAEALRGVLDGGSEAGGDGLDRAFRTLVRNRVSRGGILAPGAGVMLRGENGRGLASRWYPETLARRLRALGALRDRVAFVHGDAFDAIDAHADDARAAFFVDPPYTAGGKRAGARLYAHHALDHAALFACLAAARGDVLMTYDAAPEVDALAAAHGFATARVAMKSTHHAPMGELVVGRDLAWLR